MSDKQELIDFKNNIYSNTVLQPKSHLPGFISLIWERNPQQFLISKYWLIIIFMELILNKQIYYIRTTAINYGGGDLFNNKLTIII